jgi:guanylate kinase
VDIDERFAAIEEALEEIERIAPSRLETERDRLESAIQELARGVAVNPDRLAQEIAILAERWDINEELVRFRSHISEQRGDSAPGSGDQGGGGAAARAGGERRVTGRGVTLAGSAFPVIFAAPSGAGKTSIAHALRESRDDVEFSISATTRPPRPGERDGVDYFFHSEKEFRRMIDAGELLEWAVVHGNLYGTPRRNLEGAASRGSHLILDIDVQGSRLVRSQVPEAVSIFVLPPSGGELARRLIGRGSETEEVRRRRLTAAREELLAAKEFDYVVVNDSLDHAVALVGTILAAERQRISRIPSLQSFVDGLVAEVDEEL